MRLGIGLLVLVFICFFVNPAYSENAPDESSIFQLFDDMETAWNAEDAPSYMNFFHKSVKLKLGKPGNVKYFTWDEYAKVLPERMKKFGPFKMVNPKVLKLDGESAKAKVIVRKKSRDYTNVFNMIWEDNRWQITSNEW